MVLLRVGCRRKMLQWGCCEADDVISILDWDVHFVSGGRSSYGVNATNLGHTIFTMDIDPLSETCNSGFVTIWPLYSPLDVATRPEVWKNCSQVAQAKGAFLRYNLDNKKCGGGRCGPGHRSHSVVFPSRQFSQCRLSCIYLSFLTSLYINS